MEAMTGVGTEDDIPPGERKTVTDFCYLLDKSKQLFNGLRSDSNSHYSLVSVIVLAMTRPLFRPLSPVQAKVERYHKIFYHSDFLNISLLSITITI